jgi:putative glutamine amidotransferase
MKDSPLIASAWLKPDYRSALEQAGARIRELTPVDVLPAALDDCDAVMLTGGVDVDPARYGASERHPTVEVDPERDTYELSLARLALERDMPLLAICRGAQVVNVVAGGTLIQDIPSARAEALQHQQAGAKDQPSHLVRVVAGTCLSQLFPGNGEGEGALLVNSRHHQSVDRLAPGFIVSATAPDGIIEAFERPGSRFCLGVQWHPENFWRSGSFSELFDALVDAARRYRAGRSETNDTTASM